MKYAHIFNARSRKHRLLITTGMGISEGVISDEVFDSKTEAKKAARAAGAKAWNY